MQIFIKLEEDDLFDNEDLEIKWDSANLSKTKKNELIKLGQFLFENTDVLYKKYSGNNLKCVNCHLQHGTDKFAIPVYNSLTKNPDFDEEKGSFTSLSNDIAHCFINALNGKAPNSQSKTMLALRSYIQYLGKEVPKNAKVKHTYVKFIKLPKDYTEDLDTVKYNRGQKVYAKNCAFCHGSNGEGEFNIVYRNNKKVRDYIFPALWGKASYTWGSSMSNIDVSAAFIKHAMPLSGHSLSLRETWDVAVYINSHERPQDPRYLGRIENTRNAFHNNDLSTYGIKSFNTKYRNYTLGSMKKKRPPRGDTHPDYIKQYIADSNK